MEVETMDKGAPPPPPSPLTGCYLLIVIGEPHCHQHKDIILQRVAKGLLSWDVNACLVDLEKELAVITEQALEGEEARYGERLIQFASENLVTEILIHPVVSTLAQCVRNLLSSFTRHRHIIHAGYTFSNNGSWILQDGTFSLADFSEAFQEVEVLRVIRAYENGISLDIHCGPEGEWPALPQESFTKSCKVRLNPDDVLTSGSASIRSFLSYLEPFLVPADLDTVLESSDVVGNIRFSRPTLYVFPGGQGDAALFGINGFNMLLDGGFSRKACFWDFVRHLDRLDAVLLTRLNNSNVNGISAVLRRKKQNAVYPQIGHFFCNIQERKALLSPDGDKDKDPLLINLLEEGHEIVSNLKHLSLAPQVCYRDSEPINLYHKVGHGTLDMYVLSPAKDSKEVREFLHKWNNNDQKLFANKSNKEFTFPLQNMVSICALLVWQPANPEDTITRILFPGSSPQSRIFEGLDRIKSLDFIKQAVCSEKSLAPSTSIKSKMDKIILQPEKKTDVKKEVLKNGDTPLVKKSDSTESEKSLIKPKESKPKPKPKPRSDSQQRKLTTEKKASPKKTNGELPKPKPKISPRSTPAKSTKEANNRKVLESKTKVAPPKKEPPKPPTKERKPISRRPKELTKVSSPTKKMNGVQKPDTLRRKLDKEGTTDSSTVSTPSADPDSIYKKDISKLTADEIKAQELADLKEEQEAVKEIEAVFSKGEIQPEKSSDFRKVQELEKEEYLIIEKTEIEIQEEAQKIVRDSEESEKIPKEGSKEISVQSPEEKMDLENEVKETAPESQPDEKGSANVESGATTTAPTLPEDERMPLDDIKEVICDQIIEEKHIKEETKEKDFPVQLPMKTFETVPKPIVGIRLDKQTHIRDLVKTPDEVADLPVHEEVDIDQPYHDYQKPEEEQKKSEEDLNNKELSKSPDEEKDQDEHELELKKEVCEEPAKEDPILSVKEDIDSMIRIDDKLQQLKESSIVTIDHKVEEPEHAIAVVLTADSNPETPLGEEPKKWEEEKLELGQKSPKEREGDVEKIVKSVAEVLKSDAPLEEFEGKLPFAIPYKTYTTELRETHITTLDSPITDENKSSFPEEEERKIAPILEEPEGSQKLSKMMQDSKDLMEATSRMISDIKSSTQKTEDGEEVPTVHRMLVTASSEDGGEETEICPVGTINFSRSSESSGRSSPDPHSQKVSQKSSVDTFSEGITTVVAKSKEDTKDTKAVIEKICDINQTVQEETKEELSKVLDTDNNIELKTDTKEEPKQEVLFNGNEKTEGIDLYNGLQSVEKMVVDILIPDREELSSAPIKEKEPTPIKDFLEHTKEVIASVLTSEEVQKEEVLEKSAENLQENYETLTDMTKSVIFEKCETETKEDNTEKEKILEDSAENLEENYQIVDDLSKSIVFDKCEVLDETQKIEKVLEKEATDLVENYETLADMSKSIVFETCEKSDHEKKPEEEVTTVKDTESGTVLTNGHVSSPEDEKHFKEVTIKEELKSVTTKEEDNLKESSPDLLEETKELELTSSVKKEEKTISFENQNEVSIKGTQEKASVVVEEVLDLAKETVLLSGKLSPALLEETEKKELSGKSTPELKETTEKEEKKSVPSGKSTPDLKEVVEKIDSPLISGKSSPAPLEKPSHIEDLVHKTSTIESSLELTKEKEELAKETIPESSLLFGKSSPTPQDVKDSIQDLKIQAEEPVLSETKETALIVDSKTDSPLLSGKSTPEPSAVLANEKEVKESTIVEKTDSLESKTPLLSGKSTPEPSAVLANEKEVKESTIVEKTDSLESKTPLLSGKTTPEPTAVLANEKEVKESTIVEKTDSLESKTPLLSGKTTPEPTAVLANEKEVKESTIVEKTDSLESKTPLLSGKTTPEPTAVLANEKEVKESTIVEKTDSLESKTPLLSGKTTPEPTAVLANEKEVKESTIVEKTDSLESKTPLLSGKTTPEPTAVLANEKEVKESTIVEKTDSLESKTSLLSGKSTPELSTVLANEKESTIVEKTDSLESKTPFLPGKSTPEPTFVLGGEKEVKESTKTDSLEGTPASLSGKSSPAPAEVLGKDPKIQAKEEETSVPSGKALHESLEKTSEITKEALESTLLFGKASPTPQDVKDSIQDLKIQEEELSVLSELKEKGLIVDSKTDSPLLSGKSSPALKEEVIEKSLDSTLEKVDLIKEVDSKTDSVESKSSIFSGKSSPTQKEEKLIQDSKTSLEDTSGKSTPDKVEEKDSKTDSVGSKSPLISGKSSPMPTIEDSKLTEEQKSVLSGKSTPDKVELIKESKTDSIESKYPLLSGKSSPTPKKEEAISDSGKSTPDKIELIKEVVTDSKADSVGSKSPLLSGKTSPIPKEEVVGQTIQDSKNSLEEKLVLSGKSTPDKIELIKEVTTDSKTDSVENKSSLLSGKTSPSPKDEKLIHDSKLPLEDKFLSSGKSTPEKMELIEDSKPDSVESKSSFLSGKASPAPTEEVVEKLIQDSKPSQEDTFVSSETVELLKDSKPDSVESKSPLLSGKTSPTPQEEVVEKLIQDTKSLVEDKLLSSGKSTPEKVELIKDFKPDSVENKSPLLSGKASPTPKEELVEKLIQDSKPSQEDKFVSSETVELLKDSKPDSIESKSPLLSGKSSPTPKEEVVGKLTQNSKSSLEDKFISSGKSTPEKVELIQDSKHDSVESKSPLLSGKTSPTPKEEVENKFISSGKSTPEKVELIKDSKHDSVESKSPLLSGKASPTPKEKVEDKFISSGKSTPELIKDSKADSIESKSPLLSEKASPTPKEGAAKKLIEDSKTSLEDKVLSSGKSTPEKVELIKDSKPDSVESKSPLLSGKASPTPKEEITEKLTQDSKISLEDKFLSSGKSTPEKVELLKEVTSDSGTSSPAPKEELLEKSIPKETKIDSLESASLSGKSSPAPTEELLKKTIQDPKIQASEEQSLVPSGKASPVLKEVVPEDKSTTPSGKYSPEPSEVVEKSSDKKIELVNGTKVEIPLLSGKSSPVPPTEVVEKTISELKLASSEKKLSETEAIFESSTIILSGKTSPTPKDVKDSKELIEDVKTTPLISGTSSPTPIAIVEEKIGALKEETLSGKTSELIPSGKSSQAPLEVALEKENSIPDQMIQALKEESGKISPEKIDILKESFVDPLQNNLSGKSSPGLLPPEIQKSVDLISGKSSPGVPKEAAEKLTEETKTLLSGKSSPAPSSKLDESHHSGKSSPSPKESLPSGKSSPPALKETTIESKPSIPEALAQKTEQSQKVEDLKKIPEPTCDTPKSESVKKEDLLTIQTPEKKLSISDVEISFTQEPLEKHILHGSSTPPTVPTSPIKESFKSHTPEYLSGDEDEVPGSPLSVTSQVPHSRSSSRYDFEDDRIGTTFDPMNTSFYGALPDEPPDFEDVLTEHRSTRGEDLFTTQQEPSSSHLFEITQAKFSSPKKAQAPKDDANLMSASFMGESFDTWGKPLGLPSPAPPDNRGTPKKERKLAANVNAKNKLNDDKKRSESPSKYRNKKIVPVYVDLTYVPHHGNGNYSYVDFFKRVRARYYVFSGIEPSREVYNALLEAKQTWEDKDLEVTIIPTYDTDILGYWVAENEELLTKFKIDLSPSASRCTINLQDHETSCSAYRLEF